MVTIVRYGEIGTKGDYVRKNMTNTLIRNIKSYLKHQDMDADIKDLHGRVYINKDIDLKKIFGVVSYSTAKEIDLTEDLDEVYKEAFTLYKGGKFRVSCQRMNKNFPLTSQEVNRKVGEYIFNKGGEVDLTNFEQEIFVEIVGNKVFVFDEKKSGPGGLPLGSTGKMLAIIKNEKDSYAAMLMMKRGVCVDVVGDSEKIKKISFGYRVRELESIPENVFDIYHGLIFGLELKNGEELEEYKKLFDEYRYIYTPLAGYEKIDLINLWKE